MTDYTNEYEEAVENIEEPTEDIDNVEQILENVSHTLKILEEETQKLNMQLEELSELNTTVVNLRQISDNLSQQIYTDCLSEYKKIITNASKNYNQMQQAATKWQKKVISEQEQTFKLVKYSALITPVLLAIIIILQIL